jgi:hypothetical protein
MMIFQTLKIDSHENYSNINVKWEGMRMDEKSESCKLKEN